MLRSGAVGLGIGTIAGCAGRTTGSDNADVTVGPGGSLVFDPEELTVDKGETVTWSFETAGHNVSGRPEDSDLVRLPEGAASFSSYGTDESPRSLVPAGEVYEHRFGTQGTYQYVCIPHAPAGMVGRIVVEG